MLLTVKERLLILAILPVENDLLTMRVISELKGILGLSEEEFKTYNVVRLPEGQIQWDIAKDKGVEKNIGDKAKEIIASALTTLDKNKKVTEDFLGLFERFVPVTAPKA
jgi:hypothetical protein